MSSIVSPFVYIIIPNYHSENHTIECLETVLKQHYDNYKVIVVDNSNGNGSLEKMLDWCAGKVEKVETTYPEFVFPLLPKPVAFNCVSEDELGKLLFIEGRLLFIKANENNGFAAANNVALRYLLNLNVDFDWVWLLNNDTVVPPDCLPLFAKNSIHLPPKTGLVGTKLLVYANPNVLQGIGGRYNKWLGTVKQVGEGENDNGQYDSIAIKNNVDYIIAASVFVSKEFLKSVGLMCEDYFFFFEELDWTVRGKKKGWDIGFLPQCKVYHKEGGSSTDKGLKSILVDVAAVRNRYLFTRKFFPQFLPSVSFALLGVIVNRIKRRQFSRIPILFKAVFTNQNPKVFVGARRS